jgi:hypothetical protein
MKPLIRPIVVLSMLLSVAAPAAGQQGQHAGHGGADSDQAAVRAVIDRLFDGMRERDAGKMRSAFHADARLHGLGNDGAVRITPAEEFVAGILRAQEGLVLDEVLGEVEIRIDGPLASAWTYYDFYAGDNFSHCGYNAFQLLLTGGEWKVVSITDSRRREGCLQRRARP